MMSVPHMFNLYPPQIGNELKCNAMGRILFCISVSFLWKLLKMSICILIQLTVYGHKSKKDLRKALSGVF